MKDKTKTWQDTVRECIKSGFHLRSCDDDGYCNYCGYQESKKDLKGKK